MKRFELAVPAALLATLCLPLTASAQSADDLPPELLACAAETDVARRLDCFDREMAKLSESPEPEAPPEPVAAPAADPVIAESAPVPEPATAEPVPEPAAAPVAAASAVAAPPATGVSAPAAAAPVASAVTAASTASTIESVPSPEPAPTPTPERDPGENFGLAPEGPKEISAKVTDIMTRAYGELVILLDNGQIWEQKHRDNRFRLAIGEDVTISEGIISGYRLTGGGRNNSIQVERLK